MQSVLIARFEFRATDRAVFLINLACDVLVLITTFFAAKDAAQLLERLQTMLAFGTTGGLETDVRLVPLHCIETSSRAVLVIVGALREKGCALRALHLLRRPALVVPNAPGPCGFVEAVLVAILRSAVAVIKHALALSAAFHSSLPLFTAQIFSCAFCTAMPVCWTARRERLPAPGTGLWEVLAVFFTGHGYPSALQPVSPRQLHSPS